MHRRMGSVTMQADNSTQQSFLGTSVATCTVHCLAVEESAASHLASDLPIKELAVAAYFWAFNG